MNNAHVWAEAINNTQIENAQRLIENAQALEMGGATAVSGLILVACQIEWEGDSQRERDRETAGERGQYSFIRFCQLDSADTCRMRIYPQRAIIHRGARQSESDSGYPSAYKA